MVADEADFADEMPSAWSEFPGPGRGLKKARVGLKEARWPEGAGSGDIVVDGGDISKAAAPVAFRDGASDKAVKVRA